MRMREKKALLQATFTAAAQFDREHISRTLYQVGFTFGAQVTAAGGGAVSGLHQDAPYSLLAGDVEIQQSGRSLVRMAGRDWRHVSAYQQGGYPQRLAATPGAGATGATVGSAFIDFERFYPGPGNTPLGVIDARTVTISLRGRFGALVDYATTNVAAIAGELRPTVRAIAGPPLPDFRLPSILSRTVPIDVVDSGITTTYTIDRLVLLRAIYFRVSDASAEPTAGRVDGLLRAVRIESSRTGEIYTSRWGAMRQESSEVAGFNDEDHVRAAGTALIFLEDDDFAEPGVLLMPGDSLTIFFDTATPVESEFTAVTAGAGDQCIVVPMFFDVARTSDATDARGADLVGRAALTSKREQFGPRAEAARRRGMQE